MTLSSQHPLTLAHDYFTQRGGAERVAARLIEELQPERVVAALHDAERSFPLPPEALIETTGLQRFPIFRRDPRLALALLPLAWRRRPPVTEGVLLCSSAGWSHQLRASGDAVKIVYCHNPPRWLYQADQYLRQTNWVAAAFLKAAAPWLRRVDRRTARSADLYLANSAAVAARVWHAYGVEAEVVPPPVMIDAEGDRKLIELPWPHYFLSIGRARGYKNTGLLIDTFAELPDANLVVVGAVPGGASSPNVHIVTDISDAELRWLYANATALVSVSDEDFGLTPIEANAFGTPALVLRAGGFLDSVHEGVSGLYIDRADILSIRSAVQSFPDSWDRDRIRAHAERFSVERFVERLRQAIDRAIVGRRDVLEPLTVDLPSGEQAPLVQGRDHFDPRRRGGLTPPGTGVG